MCRAGRLDLKHACTIACRARHSFYQAWSFSDGSRSIAVAGGIRGSVTACRVQVLARTEMAREQRIRLKVGSLDLLFRLGCQAPVHSACHVLVSRRRCRKRRGRPGDWETKRAAHGRRGQRQPRDEGRQGSTCAQRSQESGAAHELPWPARALRCRHRVGFPNSVSQVLLSQLEVLQRRRPVAYILSYRDSNEGFAFSFTKAKFRQLSAPWRPKPRRRPKPV